ncbi:hypothetical protein HUJ05_010901 [Dendroctonus ponderosae]|nr:hypothetical protein HUJ05_009633 [Dendroctonus ponderosae]KAH0998447.1 hypothetical protein HUJ05_010901 [Dendroctonus ponderosae]
MNTLNSRVLFKYPETVMLQIYVQKRLTWDGSTLLKHTLQFLAVLSSVFTAMTRVSDYKHHWSDVLSGLLLGTIIAWIVAIYFARYRADDVKLRDTYIPI